MIIYGIDLSSPSNPADTAMAKFEISSDGNALHCLFVKAALSDQDIIDEIVQTANADDDIAVALDCPLSYQDGGGSRPSDTSLRNAIKRRGPMNPSGIGMNSSSVMAPLYLSQITIRGMHISRTLEHYKKDKIGIVEVHPGATIGLHMTDRRPSSIVPYEVPSCVLDYKGDRKLSRHEVLHARRLIILWMENMMLMKGIPAHVIQTSHEVDACAAALAGWKWRTGGSAWRYPASPPEHPYDFSC